MSLQPTPNSPQRRPWWRSRLLCAALVLVLACAFHASLLCGLASVLIVDDRPSHVDQAARPAGYVLVLDGDRCYDRAAELYHQGAAEQLLLIDWHAGRLVRLGILPSRAAVGRRELLSRGVPNDKVTVVPGGAGQDWQAARRLESWLQGQPHARVTALCNRFDSRGKRRILAMVLGESLAGRLEVYALPDRRFDETNWWRSKTGVKGFFNSAFNLVYDGLRGESAVWGPEWDPDQYEKTLL